MISRLTEKLRELIISNFLGINEKWHFIDQIINLDSIYSVYEKYSLEGY